MGIVRCGKYREECKLKHDPPKDGSLVMPMMMAILIEILNQLSLFSVNTESELVVFVPQ